MTTSVCIYCHDHGCLELYAFCLTPMALEHIKRPEQKLFDIFGLIRQIMITFTSPAKRRKSFRPSVTAANSQSLYTRVAQVKTAGSMARARPYSRKITHYASIMPSTAKYVLFPLLCRHNLRKPTPPPVTERNGIITNYTLSCSPSPPSLPQSTSQSESLIVNGFSPNTLYSCSVVATISQRSGPPSTISFTTPEDCKTQYSVVKNLVHYSLYTDSYFQLHLHGLTSCPEFTVRA